MKILLVQETDWFTKGPLQQNYLMEKLSLKGHQIHVIDHEILWKTHGKKELYSRRQVFNNVSALYKGSDITVIRPGIVKLPNLDYISIVFSREKEIRRQMEGFNPDIVVGFHILTPYLAMRYAKKNRIPFIYYCCDTYHSQIPFKPYQSLGKIIEERILRGADRVVATSEKLMDLAIQMGADPERSCVVRASVDLGRFNPAIDTSEMKNRYGIKDSDIILCFVGGFHKDLGLKELIPELAKVKNPDVKLLLVGEGDQTAPDEVEELRGIAEKCKISDRVILTGRRPYDEVPALMNTADICLLPAYSREMMEDVIPIKLYEYMAMKKPVIATKHRGVMREFGNDNGIIYVDRPDDAVARAVELVHSGRMRELEQKALAFVQRNSWDNIVDEFEKVLEEAIEEKRNKRISKQA